MLICPTCEGRKILKVDSTIELCPKCQGKGQIESTVKEEKVPNQQILYG